VALEEAREALAEPRPLLGLLPPPRQRRHHRRLIHAEPAKAFTHKFILSSEHRRRRQKERSIQVFFSDAYLRRPW
jgi:hypothetical protein